MDLESLIDQLQKLYTGETWVVQVFIVVFGTLLLDWIQKRIFKKLHKQLEKTRTYWDDALIESASKPISLFWIRIFLRFRLLKSPRRK